MDLTPLLDYLVTAFGVVSAALIACGACLAIGYRWFGGDERRANSEFPRMHTDE